MIRKEFLIAIGFFAEVLSFNLTGYSIALEKWSYVIIFALCAMVTALVVGKLIEQRAIEKYKEGLK